VLQGIHQDLNQGQSTKSTPPIIGDGTNDEETATKSWERHLIRDKSFIVDKMYGFLRSKLWCPKCHKTSVIFESYLSLVLPLRGVPSLHVTFVPLDIGSPASEFEFQITEPVSEAVVEEALRRELGRDVSIVLAGRRRDGVDWGYPGDAPYAFEAPDGEVLLPCVVRGGKPLEALTRPFLVGVSKGKIDRDALQGAVKERLASVLVGASEEEDVKTLEVFVTWSTPKNQNDLRYQAQDIYPRRGRICGVTATVLLGSGVTVGGFPLLPTEQAHGSSARSLADCLELNRQRETLSEDDLWICEQCGEIVSPDKKVDIWSVPEVLVIHLKRFNSVGFRVQKLDDYIDYPDRIDLKDYIAGPQGTTEQIYRLYAVSNHYGSVGGGHYTANAIVQDPLGQPDLTAPWYSFNDSSASPSHRDCHSSAGYLLFYERLSTEAQ
jgi:ubiquitin carboxyl-terminal hydrolase 4/11/15